MLSIVGDVLRVALPPRIRNDPEGPRFGDLALVSEAGGPPWLAQVVHLDEGEASLQVFSGTAGLSTRTQARFLGHAPKVVFSPNIMGRVFARQWAGGGRRAVAGARTAGADRRTLGESHVTHWRGG